MRTGKSLKRLTVIKSKHTYMAKQSKTDYYPMNKGDKEMFILEENIT